MCKFVICFWIFYELCGHFISLLMAPQVRSDLRFEIYDQIYICHHVCYGCLVCWETKIKKDELASTRPVSFAAGKKNKREENSLS